MRFPSHVWRSASLIVAALLILIGCDAPTSEPSINTSANFSPPIVASKTYSFLGGPDSENEPLIDTTSFKSAPAVRRATKAIPRAVESKISVNQGFEETLLSEDDDLANQTARAEKNFSLERSNAASSPTAKSTVAFEGESPDLALNSKTTGFRAVAADAGRSDFYVQIENNTGATLESVDITLRNEKENATSVSDDFGGVETDFEVGKTFNNLGDGDKESAKINDWSKPIMNVLRAEVAAEVSGTPSTDPQITVCLGGANCIDANAEGTLGVQTLYFISDGESLTAEGSVDVLDTGRSEFGPEADIELLAPTLKIGGLKLQNDDEGLPREFQFASFTLRYTNKLFDGDGNRLEYDLLNALNKNLGNCSASDPCRVTVPDERRDVEFRDLGKAEKVDFELEAVLPGPNDSEAKDSSLIANVGDKVVAEEAGLPIADSIDVNWFLENDGNPEDDPRQATIRDTIDADFSGFKDLTDPDNNVRLDAASLRLKYTNNLPLGGDMQLIVLDENSASIDTLNNANGKPLTVEPAVKNSDGTAGTPGEGTLKPDVGTTQDALRELGNGQKLRLRLNLTQEAAGPDARIRADDTFRFNLKIDTESTINSN